MKNINLALLCIATILSGCAAKLNFIDRSDGAIYIGETGGTAGGSGEASAMIENVRYAGPWIYSSSGGGYSLGTFSSGTMTGTATAFGVSAQGRGLINMKADNGMHMRCVFDFNSMSNTGLGQCQRNDGRAYDLTIKR